MKDKWQTLEHNGPLFPKEYEYIGFDKKLSSLAEEMLYHYSVKLETEYVLNSTFNKNFWNDLKSQLPIEYQSKTLEDFMPLCKKIFKYIQNKKEEKKLETKELKLAKLKEKEEIKEKYGYCILNGERQPIASPVIEGPGIFIARGSHPQIGKFKFRIQPEDVTINASNLIEPPIGHQWKKIEENKGSMQLCSYEFTLSSGYKLYKRVLFAATSIVKQNADQKKFDKALKLIKNWKKIESHIEKNLNSKDNKIKQAAVVTYLIMNLGIRVGDEKGSDEADTVGASSLRHEHLFINGNKLKLDFDGKDSVHYTNEIEISESVSKVLIELFSKTKDGDMIFPDVTSGDISEFLSEVVEGLTAKVFRTAHGSSLLAKSLRELNINDCNINEKVIKYNQAQLVVAKKLNHQKNVGKNYVEQDKKNKEKFDSLTLAYEDIKKNNEILINELKNKIKQLKNKDLSEENKKVLKESYEKKIEKYKNQIDKAYCKASDFELSWKLKEETKNIALGTSKASYCSPRIIVSWCKDMDVPISKLYSKSLQEKFSWAIDSDKDYYKKYPII